MSEWKTAGKVRMTPKGVHDSTIAYNILDLVSNEDHTMYYIAKQDVPANTLLTNTDYWDVVTDVSEIPDQISEIEDDVTELKSDISQEEKRLGEYDKGIFVHPVHWERGTINTTTGEDQANNYRICSNKIYYGDYDKINIVIPSGYSMYFFAYGSDDSLLGKTGWFTTSGAIYKTQYTGTAYLRFVIQVTNEPTSVVPMSVIESITIWSKSLLSNANTGKVCYVSPLGNDTNAGTKTQPFATIKKGIDEGFKNICVIAGDYVQAVSANGINNIHIYADNADTYTSYTKRKKPTFLNGKTYASFQTDNSGYKYFTPDSVPSSYTAVFINHTQDPIITGSYPSYRASLWANHSNKYDDFRVKPVLTYEELAENNTFYYDGSQIYFHITDTITGVTVSGDTDYIFNFTSCDGLEIEGISILYGKTCNLRVLKSNDVSIKNCDFGYTMRSNCVTTDYSNVIFENCEAFKATIDGFNAHSYGVSVYNDCRGMYNYDDGESSHEYCEIIVNGGEYAHNEKGGHAPVNGCKFKCNGTYTHHNGYGFYMVGNDNFELEDILISNSVAQDNSTYDLQNTFYNTKYWNCKIDTVHVSSGTVTNLTQ